MRIVLGIIPMLVATVAHAQPALGDNRAPEATLYGFVEPEQDLVRLYWETRNWPLWLNGYRLRVRQGSGNDWQDLHTDPIRPSFHPERDWTNQGLTEEDRAKLMQVRAESFGTRIPDRTSEEVLTLLRNYDGLQSGDRLSQKSDFNIALFSGFAYLDHLPVDTGASVGEREYGLFAVDNAGYTASTPVSTWQAQVLSPENGAPPKVEQHVWDGIVVLKWRYDRATARERALFGFDIYRLDKESGEWELLVNNPIGSNEGDDNSLHFTFHDNAGNANVDQTYAIVGRNMFQTTFGRTEIPFLADRFRPLPTAEIARHMVVNEADVQIDWNYPADAADRVTGFYVERAENGEFERISTLLPPQSRTFRDSGSKEYSKVYDYRVIAIDKWDVEWAGPRIVLLYLGQSRPPQPENFRGSFQVQKGQPGILLEWDLPSVRDQRTASFRILSDATEQGNLRLQAQIKPFQGNRYFYPLDISGGRFIRVGLLPITEEGITGEPATTDIYMPALQLPPVTGVTASFDRNAYSVELNWEYDESFHDLKGFRILMDGQPVPGMMDWPADTRSVTFSSDTFEKGLKPRFSVLAVGGVRPAEASLPTTVWIRSDRLPEGVEPPADLKVVLVEQEEGPAVAQLSWTTPKDLEEAGLVGYALMVDYAQEGNIRRLNSLPPLAGPQFKYTLPGLEDRSSFTFQLAAITRENTLGPVSEAVLQVPEPVPGTTSSEVIPQ